MLSGAGDCSQIKKLPKQGPMATKEALAKTMVGEKLRWAIEDDDRLRKLALEGRTAETIAERLKRSRSAIRRRAEVLNVPLTRLKAGRKRASTTSISVHDLERSWPTIG